MFAFLISFCGAKIRQFFESTNYGNKKPSSPLSHFYVELRLFFSNENRNTLFEADFSKRPESAIQQDIFVFLSLVGCRVGDLTRLKKLNVVDGDTLHYMAGFKDADIASMDGHEEGSRAIAQYRKVSDRRMTKLTYHQVRYLGEWHSHPKMRNTPSATDRKLFEVMSEEQQSQDLPFVMLIHGNNGLHVEAVM